YLRPLYLPMLSWAMIAEMSRNNVDFGSHTARHLDLSRIDIQSAKRDIVESRIAIEKNIGKEVTSFAYPSGRFKRNIVDLVRRQGFRCAFGGGGTIRKGADRFAVHRVEVSRSISSTMFRMRLTPATDWYKSLHQAFKRAYDKLPRAAL